MTKNGKQALPLNLPTRVGFACQVTRQEVGGLVCLGVIIGILTI